MTKQLEEQVTYSTNAYHIPEGFYSIQEIEQMLKEMKDQQKSLADYLKRAMEPMPSLKPRQNRKKK